jgi:DNA-binding MarR family transcriptional regulator
LTATRLLSQCDGNTLISDLEYLVLASAVRLGDDAYGASVMKEVAEATGKPCSVGASYTTLDRLEEKGLITTSMGDQRPYAQHVPSVSSRSREGTAMSLWCSARLWRVAK